MHHLNRHCCLSSHVEISRSLSVAGLTHNGGALTKDGAALSGCPVLASAARPFVAIPVQFVF